MGKMKAILIARVSTEEQKEAGNSLPAQEIRLKNYCKRKNLEIINTFSFDESAYKNQRNEFDNILDFVLQQKNKVAVCFDKVDRLSRNVFDKRVSLLYERSLNDEIELHFVSDGQIINSKISAAEKFQFNISLGLAKYYSDAVSDNVKRANEQKLRQGEWIGKGPFGYKNITREDGKKDIIIDEYEARIIKKAFELYATGIYSMNSLRKKIKNDYGIDWAKSTLDKHLKRRFYYGIMEVKGKRYPHHYPPVISKNLFEQVQQVKAGFNKKQFKYAGIPFMYRGLLRCADCGLAVTPERHKGKHVYYHCTEYNGKHGAKYVKEEEITEQIGQVFKRLKLPKKILKQLIDTLGKTHKDKIEFQNMQFDKLTQEKKRITKMIDNLYMDKLEGKISEDRYKKFSTSLEERMDEVNSQLEKLGNAEKNYYITAKYLLDLANRAYELFKSSEVDEKRQLINLVLSNLKLKGKRVVYDVNKPFDAILNYQDSVLWRPQGDLNSRFRRERAMSWTRLDDGDV